MRRNRPGTLLSSRLARWRLTHQCIETMMEKGDVGVVPMREIAAHVRQCMADGRWTPRTERHGELAGLSGGPQFKPAR